MANSVQHISVQHIQLQSQPQMPVMDERHTHANNTTPVDNTCKCICLAPKAPGGPSRTTNQQQFCFSPYSLQCHACRKLGHI